MLSRVGLEAALLPSFSRVNRVIYVPRRIHPIGSVDFLNFAYRDAASSSPSSVANALGNTRRAVASRVDALLYASGLGKIAKDEQWPFPKRLNALESIGYSTPSGLAPLIINPRNMLEHEYRLDLAAPGLQSSLDLATRYLDVTDRYLELGVIRAAEFSPYIGMPRRPSLRRPRKGASLLVFDHDLDLVDFYSGGGNHVSTRLKTLGAEVIIGIQRRLLAATLEAPSLRVGLRTEDELLDLLR
jgi:hypothetical protein